jgi:hypothetical protein
LEEENAEVTSNKKSTDDRTSIIKKVEIRELDKNSIYIHKTVFRLDITKSYESLETKDVMVKKIKKYPVKTTARI